MYFEVIWVLLSLETPFQPQIILDPDYLPDYLAASCDYGKSNQTMKFGQLIEYNMKNIFFLKSHTKNVVEKLLPDPFLKNQN